MGQHPCYSGLQVQGTAISPAARKYCNIRSAQNIGQNRLLSANEIHTGIIISVFLFCVNFFAVIKLVTVTSIITVLSAGADSTASLTATTSNIISTLSHKNDFTTGNFLSGISTRLGCEIVRVVMNNNDFSDNVFYFKFVY